MEFDKEEMETWLAEVDLVSQEVKRLAENKVSPAELQMYQQRHDAKKREIEE